MKSRHQGLLLIGLSIFTFINLVPILWGFIISLKQPADAFSLPPSRIFTPTLEFHRAVWLERGFLGFLFNSFVVADGTIAMIIMM